MGAGAGINYSGGLSEHQCAVETKLGTDVSAVFLREYLSIASGKFQEQTLV
jgi:hypothetical protein